MDFESLIKIAEEKANLDDERMKEPYFVQTIAWFCYLGILRHSAITPHRHRPHLHDVLMAAQLEPRILELLPAIMVLIPDALIFNKDDVPRDLAKVVNDIKKRGKCGPFRGIPQKKYCHWLNAPVMDIARRRLDFRSAPRKRSDGKSPFSDIIRDGRMKQCLTQEAFAKKHNVSLKVLRDLEQGKTSASIGTVMAILSALGRTLRA